MDACRRCRLRSCPGAHTALVLRPWFQAALCSHVHVLCSTRGRQSLCPPEARTVVAGAPWADAVTERAAGPGPGGSERAERALPSGWECSPARTQETADTHGERRSQTGVGFLSLLTSRRERRHTLRGLRCAVRKLRGVRVFVFFVTDFLRILGCSRRRLARFGNVVLAGVQCCSAGSAVLFRRQRAWVPPCAGAFDDASLRAHGHTYVGPTTLVSCPP